MRAGVHTDLPPDAIFERVPGASVTRHFIRGPEPDGLLEPGYDLISEIDEVCQDTWDAEGLPVVSFKLRPEDVLEGLWDVELAGVAEYLRRTPPAPLIPHHEPEDDYKTEPEAIEFVRSFNYIRTHIHAVNINLPVAYCAMGYQWRPGSTTTAHSHVWRQVDADLYLCDVYSGNSFDPTLILPDHPGFARWKSEVIDRHPGRAWGVGERGILAGPTRADTIDRETDWLLGPGASCKFYLWWNTPGTEGEEGWPIDPEEHPEEAAAMRRLVAATVVPDGYHLTENPAVVVSEETGVLIQRKYLVHHIDFLSALRTL